MVLIEVKGKWWSRSLGKWVAEIPPNTGVSTARQFKTLSAARRHLKHLLDTQPNSIRFWYRNKRRDGYEIVYPDTRAFAILFGDNKNVR